MRGKIVTITTVLLFLFMLISCSESIPEIEWDTIVLSNKLPAPQSLSIEITTNDSESLDIDVINTSAVDYEAYVEQCKQFGYVIDASDTDMYYNAYNSEGYYIYIIHLDSDDKMNITLTTPIKFAAYTMPDFADDLPVPTSNMGSYLWQNENSFYLRIGDTPLEDYHEYVSACEAKGFTINPYKSETVFYADNESGYHVSVQYMGFNTMAIQLKHSEQESETKVNTETNAITEFDESETILEESSEILTISNNSDLKKLLELRDPSDSFVSTFANKYQGQTIEFDGCVLAINNHGDYKTRYDILIGSGDFDKNSACGPAFRLTDVGPFDLGIDSLYVESVFPVGTNVHIVAKLEKYNEYTTIYELNVVSIVVRD